MRDGLPARQVTNRQRRKEKTMARVFVYDDREFPDPDPEMTVDQVKGTLADFYGEIANASVKETKRGDDTIYEFQRRVGTKGCSTP
ncbi:MAG: PRTRC system protein C [Dehalococcoidia bacterium]|nr:PRTRC system protein C [Dehalococcoidia bacterium]